jgi:Zn finger protein HypA/HybF involved in hydrogenase expression
MIDSYSVKVYCQNCRIKWIIQIPKGTSIEQFKKAGSLKPECGNCGCSGLKITASSGMPAKGKIS